MLLDRMALDDVGLNPHNLAAAIHRQLGERPGPVPIHGIACALDIHEIREKPLDGFEGALVTERTRDRGAILVNARRSLQSRRYTVAHELLHFLNPTHRPTSPHGFWCSAGDMTVTASADKGRHVQQEIEANTFAIEVLAPRFKLLHLLRGDPDLRTAWTMAKELDLSREACSRRLVELHDEATAAVFSRNGKVIYSAASGDFPALAIGKGDQLPVRRNASGDIVSAMDETDPADWLRMPAGVELKRQTLRQQDGYATTLVWHRRGGT